MDIIIINVIIFIFRMVSEHNKKGKISRKEFIELINKYKNNIETTDHTFFRLSEKQRKIYTEEKLKNYLLNDEPIEVWVQENDNYAAFYKFDEQIGRVIKIIIRISAHKIYIVTFYILNNDQRGGLGK